MQRSEQAQLEELENERKQLVFEGVLTFCTGIGLVLGIYFTITGSPDSYAMSAYAVSYLAGGLPALFGALNNLVQKKLDIDLLMVLAALGAALVGEVRDGAILLFLFSLAGLLEAYAIGRTRRAVVALMDLRPDEANLEQADGQLVRVRVEKLELGQTVVVKAGERFPIDGLIVRGAGTVDQSPVTGESMPVDKVGGDAVFAGSVNGNQVLAVSVTALASQSTLARMITLVTEAQATRSPSERFSDWFGSRYTVVVLVGSIVSFFVFLLLGTPQSEALYIAATLLVVASPCAIVISVPAAVLSALASAARNGMLFKGGAALEVFGTVDIVAFDKTGTLTQGKMEVVEVVTFGGLSQTDFIKMCASIEAHSEHPLAVCVLEHAKAKGIVPNEVTNTTTIPGKGLEVEYAGRRHFAGNRTLLMEKGIAVSADTLSKLNQLEETGRTILIVGNEETVLGCIAIADSVRDTALEGIQKLKNAGVKRIVMLTGDTVHVARAIGAQLGIAEADIYAGLLPEDKVAIIHRLRKEGIVAFVGDGINDAAALATAHVGIAMGVAGSAIALEAADVAFLSEDMRKIADAQSLGRKANIIIKQNLVFALGIMMLMVVVTLFFYLPLPLGVIGHEGGTLLVVANGLRLLFEGRKK
jgi:Zn2+/Cd2+-exporting ATPase